MRQKKDALDEITSKRDEMERQKNITKNIVKQMMECHVHIDSSRTIQKKIKEIYQEEIPFRRIQGVMRNDMDMSYTKMKNASLHANSNTNLILRQRFAIKLL